MSVRTCIPPGKVSINQLQCLHYGKHFLDEVEHSNHVVVCPARPKAAKQLAQCAQCKTWVSDLPEEKSKHINICIGSPACTHICSTCGASFGAPHKKNNHVNNGCPRLRLGVVTFFRIIDCDRCWEKFDTITDLRGHRLQQHPPDEQKAFKCSRCGQGFKTKYGRDKVHMALCGKSVEEKTEHKCAECDRGFPTPYKRNEHQKTCKRFQCKHCQQFFTSHDDLHIHLYRGLCAFGALNELSFTITNNAPNQMHFSHRLGSDSNTSTSNIETSRTISRKRRAETLQHQVHKKISNAVPQGAMLTAFETPSNFFSENIMTSLTANESPMPSDNVTRKRVPAQHSRLSQETHAAAPDVPIVNTQIAATSNSVKVPHVASFNIQIAATSAQSAAKKAYAGDNQKPQEPGATVVVDLSRGKACPMPVRSKPKAQVSNAGKDIDFQLVEQESLHSLNFKDTRNHSNFLTERNHTEHEDASQGISLNTDPHLTVLTPFGHDHAASYLHEACISHRLNHGGYFSSDVVIPTNSKEIAPEKFLDLFVNACSEALSAQELQSLAAFLQQKDRQRPDSMVLRKQTDERIHRFCDEEVILSGESRERLSTASGPAHAELGLLLHCQTREGNGLPFWNDDQSQTLLSLKRKGVSPDFAFGFDVHWRPALPGYKNKGCPAKKFPPGLRALHDGVTSDLLNNLPFHLLLVGGSCAMEFHRKVAKDGKVLRIRISPAMEIHMLVEFRTDGSCRITAYLPHPASVFYNKSTSSSDCMHLDSVISFFLWLLNQKYTEDAFSSDTTNTKGAVPNGAPFKLLSSYRKQEMRKNRVLKQEDYETSFWLWTQRYLGTAAATAVMESGNSIVEAVNNQINERRSQA